MTNYCDDIGRAQAQKGKGGGLLSGLGPLRPETQETFF